MILPDGRSAQCVGRSKSYFEVNLPDSLPISVLLYRIGTFDTPEEWWVRVKSSAFASVADSHGGFKLLCRRCGHADHFSFFEQQMLPLTESLLGSQVTVDAYRNERWGIYEEIRFWLPVTVWLGVCERCGTVYWDRD